METLKRDPQPMVVEGGDIFSKHVTETYGDGDGPKTLIRVTNKGFLFQKACKTRREPVFSPIFSFCIKPIRID
jgi:hypothetical protein